MTSPTPEVFHASKRNGITRMRFLLIAILLGTPAALIAANGLSTFNAVVCALAAGLAFALDRLSRKQLGFGKPLLILTDDELNAPNLSGQSKRLRWADIASIGQETVQGHNFIRFRLKSAATAPKRGFWSRLSGDPSLSLNAFSPEDQARVFDALLAHHARHPSFDRTQAQQDIDDAQQAKSFEAGLQALQPRPWATYLLIALNLGVWLLTLNRGAGLQQTPSDLLLLWGGNAASEVQRGEFWRLTSATFLHSGVLHVMMNMFGLYSAGVLVERIYGTRQFLLIYFGAGLLGSALSLHFAAQSAVSVGASGAVFGVAGALLVAVLQHRERIPKAFSKETLTGVGSFLVYSLLQGFAHAGIDNAAHIGGLLGGSLAAYLLPERFDLESFRRLTGRRTGIAFLTLSSVLLSVGLTAPEATLDQRRLVESPAIAKRAFQQFNDAINTLKQADDDVSAGRRDEHEVIETLYPRVSSEFRAAASDYKRLGHRPGDPRIGFAADMTRVAELFAELLELPRAYDPEERKYAVLDRTREQQIEAELKTLTERIAKFIAETKK